MMTLTFVQPVKAVYNIMEGVWGQDPGCTRFMQEGFRLHSAEGTPTMCYAFVITTQGPVLEILVWI